MILKVNLICVCIYLKIPLKMFLWHKFFYIFRNLAFLLLSVSFFTFLVFNDTSQLTLKNTIEPTFRNVVGDLEKYLDNRTINMEKAKEMSKKTHSDALEDSMITLKNFSTNPKDHVDQGFPEFFSKFLYKQYDKMIESIKLKKNPFIRQDDNDAYPIYKFENIAIDEGENDEFFEIYATKTHFFINNVINLGTEKVNMHLKLLINEQAILLKTMMFYTIKEMSEAGQYLEETYSREYFETLFLENMCNQKMMQPITPCLDPNSNPWYILNNAENVVEKYERYIEFVGFRNLITKIFLECFFEIILYNESKNLIENESNYNFMDNSKLTKKDVRSIIYFLIQGIAKCKEKFYTDSDFDSYAICRIEACHLQHPKNLFVLYMCLKIQLTLHQLFAIAIYHK
ncbi:hypothetical protein EDEG_02031 [Edhazardia aedis USNM 41457]|uniref:Uncharacterized protein n=1 Tax=Edhazardia aedis (strain USNM 41457) TaxID=1003232 RepID=J9D805_EDHAE|nr:hypothetical protein EDEG_02031 [Edhazardia aedis USNM 41457]|eukprot:EJW03634.1 hypothetical protein EDEG_02031 [Edhazardia aedis USNM 41457]